MKPNPFERLPDAVTVGGVRCAIDPDFRVGVAIETEMLAEEPDVWGLLQAFYCGCVPADVEGAAEQMLWFYASTDSGEADSGEKKPGGSTARWYDFVQDADALMASFQQAYGIDLEQAVLHWWKFRRLMFGLPADTPFMQRVHYRVTDVNKVPKEQRKQYRKMKRLYALKQSESRKKCTAEARDAAMKERVRRRFEEAQNVPKN